MNSSKSYDEDSDFPVYVYVHRLSVHKQEKALNFIYMMSSYLISYENCISVL